MFDQIHNQHGEQLEFDYQASPADSPHASELILLSHGLTGNMDRPLLLSCAQALQQAGYPTLRFSYSGNGQSQGDFAAATISKEVTDLGSVLDTISPHFAHISYIGHSMGGAVGTLCAARDPRIQRLVSLAGMVNSQSFAQTEFGTATPDQDCMWDEPEHPLSSAFMNDLCHTIGSTIPHAAKINIPWLLLHGSEDDLVLPQDSQSILDLGKPNTQLITIEGADHSFSQHHQEVTAALLEWLQK